VITADHARIPAAIALQLCAESPEALAVLCRVLWFARGSGECFASCATMRMAGAAMALPVLRRGLIALQDRGLLLALANPDRACVTYRPTSALAKSPRSVFVPPEIWRGFKPGALAAWVVWRLTGCDAGELPKHLAGRAGKRLSRSQGYALFRTLRSGGVSLEPVRKSTGAESEKDSTNTELSKTNKEYIDLMYLSNLFALPTCEPSKQLALPIRAQLRVVSPQMPEPMPADWLDWEAVSAHNPGASTAMPAPRVPKQIESVAFYDLPNAWKQLVAAYPPLEPPKVLASPSGLPPSEERKLFSSWRDCAKDWQLSDIPALAEYLHAGQLKHITSNLSNYIAINLDALLQRAEKWRKDGKPVSGASALQPQWDQGDILSQLTRNPAEARR
jgi:hypothetical protein